MPDSSGSEKLSYTGAITAIVLGLYLSSLYSYLLFHSLIEIITIAVAFTIFILTWNTRKYLTNNYLRLLGIGYAFIAFIDLLHTLAYKGMSIFPGYGANLPTQLWIAARYLQAVTLFAAPLFVERSVNNRTIFGGYATVLSVLVAMIYSGNFPDCYIEGKGLTTFKIGSEYVITVILLASLYLFYMKRKYFNDRVFFLTASSIACTALSEISFTAYVSVYGFANLVGHFARLAAFYLIYRAILVTGLTEPFDLIFRDLKQAEEALRKSQDALEEKVRDRTAELRTSEENFRRLIEDSPVAIVVTAGTDNTVQLVNIKFTKLFGYTIEDIPDLAHWWPLAYPEEKYRAGIMTEWFVRVEKAVKTKGSIEPMEATVICKDGSQRYIEFHMSSIGVRALTTFIDITERKLAEVSLRKNNEIVERIFSMTTTCIAYMDRDFNFIRVNKEYAGADDKTPEYFVGKNHFDLFPSQENEAIFRKVVETGEQHIAHAKPFEYKDHPERRVSLWDWSLAPVKNSNGTVEALILSLVNVTERIRAQEDLRRLNEELEGRVRERTAEMERKNAELEKMNRMFVGRELRMIELKERIKELEKQIEGQIREPR